MVRSIYYQSSENPIQYDRLPDRSPELELPRYSDDSDEDARFARVRFLQLLLVAPLAIAIHLLHVGAREFAPNVTLLVSSVPLALLAGVLIHRAATQRQFRRAFVALTGASAIWLHVNFQIPAALHLFLAALVLGYLAYALGEHWAFLCTASPLDRKTAQEIRAQRISYLAVFAAFPAVSVLLATVAGQVSLALLGVLVLAAYQTCETVLYGRRCSPSTLLKAWKSWFSYNRTDDPLPGVFQSPSGTTHERSFVPAVAALLLCLPLVPHVVEYLLGLVGFLPPADLPLAAGCGLKSAGVAAFFVELSVVILLPPLLVGLVPLALSLPLLHEVTQYACLQVSADNWTAVIADMRASVDPIERRSLYIGRNIFDGSPLLVPREVFQEHAHFLGDSGSGKTSQGLVPVIEQLTAGQPCSLVAVDQKADTHELYAALSAADDAYQQQTGERLPLKHFTNESDRSTFAFNPLDQPSFGELDLYQKTDILCAALGLAYGADYGESYYSSANATVFFEMNKRYPKIRSLEEAAQRVRYLLNHATRQELNPSIREAGDHVAMVLDRLAAVQALNVTPEGGYPREVLNESIDLADVFRRPQLLYFHLPCTLAPYTSPEIGRLVATLLLVAAKTAKRLFPVYLIIDEFQRMVAKNLEAMLQLARSMGVGVILANQTMEDLKTSRTNLITAIEANCRFRQCFAVSLSDDRQRIVTSSGQTVDYVESTSFTTRDDGHTSTTESTREQILSRLSTNDVLLASDHPHHSIVRITRGKGYAQLGGMACIVESDYHISRDEYERRRVMPWPSGLPGTFVPRHFQPVRKQQSAPTGPVVTTEVVGHVSTQNPDRSPDTRGSIRKRLFRKPKRSEGNTP